MQVVPEATRSTGSNTPLCLQPAEWKQRREGHEAKDRRPQRARAHLPCVAWSCSVSLARLELRTEDSTQRGQTSHGSRLVGSKAEDTEVIEVCMLQLNMLCFLCSVLRFTSSLGNSLSYMRFLLYKVTLGRGPKHLVCGGNTAEYTVALNHVPGNPAPWWINYETHSWSRVG